MVMVFYVQFSRQGYLFIRLELVAASTSCRYAWPTNTIANTTQ